MNEDNLQKELIGLNNPTALSSHNLAPANRELNVNDIDIFVNKVKAEKERIKPVEKKIEEMNKTVNKKEGK